MGTRRGVRARGGLAVVALVGALAVAGCAGDDGGRMSADAASAGGGASDSASDPSAGGDSSLLTGTMPLLNGDPQRLEDYRGDVVMVVNTASECGFTPQFEQLEALYEERRDDGFRILGFPADDFNQEPRSNEEVARFCEENFGVSFPMFAKSSVTGEEANPLFRRLAVGAGEPVWNFNKYLLDRRGRVVERFDQTVEPDDPALRAKLGALLR